ncbi:hypothetical protein GOV10_02955 [Candidatus Woesearchaeota archaeon]|nr:hypothetical protein [Candidatus Woesearchaeota archaeon]
MASWRNPTDTKRRFHIYLSAAELSIVEEQIPTRGFSEWVRNKIHEEFTFTSS